MPGMIDQPAGKNIPSAGARSHSNCLVGPKPQHVEITRLCCRGLNSAERPHKFVIDRIKWSMYRSLCSKGIQYRASAPPNISSHSNNSLKLAHWEAPVGRSQARRDFQPRFEGRLLSLKDGCPVCFGRFPFRCFAITIALLPCPAFRFAVFAIAPLQM
jgi:hypothetical protein